jgi:hypothetical protein
MKRLCYIHVGPPKTGTTSIQWFLWENRADLLDRGYLVPESRSPSHRPLALALCGESLPEQQRSAADDFARELNSSSADKVVISSEAMNRFLKIPRVANRFFASLAKLDLVPHLVLFPRNQPQLLNSGYVQMVKTFHLAEPFDAFALKHKGWFATYSWWLKIASSHGAKLIAIPFTAATIADGVVPAFLSAIGLNPKQFSNPHVRQNEAVGPLTVSIARHVLSAIDIDGAGLTLMQAVRCERALEQHVGALRVEDAGYCGLTTALAQQIEAECLRDNDAFAMHLWGRPWHEIFASDIGQDYTPSDFLIASPSKQATQLTLESVAKLIPLAVAVRQDPSLALDAPWNDRSRYIGELQSMHAFY